MSNYNPPFKLTSKILNGISKIMEILGMINYYENLSRLPKLRKQNRIRSVYSSCAIEANSLSLDQVKDIINGKTVIGPLKEILEVKNAIKAYENIEEIDPYNIEDLMNIHHILMNNIIERSGKFRLNQEGVFDGDKCIFVAPPESLVPELMGNLFAWMNENKGEIHPLIVSSVFHYEFVFIHPFKDGNGRTVRLWQNAILGKFNEIFYYVPIENYILEYQSEYYEAISICHNNGDSTFFIEFMLEMIYKTLSSLKDNIINSNNHKSVYISKLLSVMETEVPMTANEIMEKLNLKSKETFRKNYLNPAIESNLVFYEYPDKPTSKNQRYIKKTLE